MRGTRRRTSVRLALLGALFGPVAAFAQPACPVEPADIVVVADNRSDDPAPVLRVEGTLRAPEATCAGAGATSYAEVLTCPGSGVVECGRIGGLRPGAWVNRLAVTVSGSDSQVQASAAVFLAGGSARNVVTWTVYPYTSVVGLGTEAALRSGLEAAARYMADHPGRGALVTFARDAFPGPADPRAIEVGLPPGRQPPACRFAALCLAGTGVVIDALDADAQPGGVVLSVGTRDLALMRVVGSDNVVRGLVLQGSQLDVPSTQVDTFTFSGAGAHGNRLERAIVRGPTRGDATSADTDAVDNVIERCELTGARDRGLKVTTRARLEIRQSCVHDNRNGGVQSTLGGHVLARDNLIQHNVPGPSGNGFSVTGGVVDLTTLETRGNIVRFAGGRGISVTDNAEANLTSDYVADNQFIGSKVETTSRGPAGMAPRARFRGVAFVCNQNTGISGSCTPRLTEEGTPCTTDADCCGVAPDGSMPDCVTTPLTCGPIDVSLGFGASQAQLDGTPPPEVDFGTATDPGRNAFTANRKLSGGANLKHRVVGEPLPARGNQWEHCGTGDPCLTAAVLAEDVVLTPGAMIDLGTPPGVRAGTPVLTTTTPGRPRADELVRVFGDNFNAIEGTGCAGATAPVEPCSAENPGRTAAHQIDLLSGTGALLATVAPDAVTPTMLAFRMPFDCFAPLVLRVSRLDPSGQPVSATVGLCSPDACADQPATTPCEDGNPCTVNDHCSGEGDCVPGEPRECGGPCLTGECSPSSGCVPRPGSTACDDGDACTTGDHCSGTDDACLAAPRACTAPCETGACDHEAGCLLAPADMACEDGDACTLGDRCASDGACVAGGAAPTCAGTCLTGACNPARGCVPRAPTAPCDDANACTVGDHCSGVDGTCTAGGTRACADACLTGVCDPVAGCVAESDGAVCTPDDVCRVGSCMGAACRPGGARDCDDGDTCTRDSCEARAGCVHAPVQGHDAVACCLPKVALDCSVKKIRRRLAKQWGRAAHALVAAVRTPAPRREKRLQRALDRLQALRRRCPDGPPPPDCLNQGV